MSSTKQGLIHTSAKVSLGLLCVCECGWGWGAKWDLGCNKIEREYEYHFNVPVTLLQMLLYSSLQYLWSKS